MFKTNSLSLWSLLIISNSSYIIVDLIYFHCDMFLIFTKILNTFHFRIKRKTFRVDNLFSSNNTRLNSWFRAMRSLWRAILYFILALSLFFLTLFDERINRSMILEGEINKNINKREELTNWRFYSTDIWSDFASIYNTWLCSEVTWRVPFLFHDPLRLFS